MYKRQAVGRLIDMVVAAAWSQELPVTICGVSATDPDTAERFIRQGVRGLCMDCLLYTSRCV